MKRILVVVAVVVMAAFAYAVGNSAHRTQAWAMAGAGPTGGFTLHIDADRHFGDEHPNEIAHHWCKGISKTLTECQIYDGDGPSAKLVGVETIVPAAVWKTFPAVEQAKWHYHRTELKKIHATLPGMPKDQQAKVIASILETYGKVYILWDPMTSANPLGDPSLTILK